MDDAEELAAVLETLFEPSFVALDTSDLPEEMKREPLTQLGLTADRVRSFVQLTRITSKKLYSKEFTQLTSSRRDAVVETMMANDVARHFYSLLLAVAFADPRYGFNPSSKHWHDLGYESFQYFKLDGWSYR